MLICVYTGRMAQHRGEVPRHFHDVEGRQKVLEFFFAGAASCEVDKQGRIRSTVLREYAGLTKDVVLVGVLSRVEIWDKDRWAENTYDEDEMDEIAEHMADLGFSI